MPLCDRILEKENKKEYFQGGEIILLKIQKKKTFLEIIGIF